MSDAPNTVATLNGLFKVVYADKMQDLVPDYAIIQKKIPFVTDEKQTGAYYAQPVNLTQESGFTYNGTAGGVVTLADAVNGTMKEAQVYGSELILRAQLTYAALSRAASAGPRAFKKASAWKVLDMNNSMHKRLECGLLYGQKPIATVSSVAATDLVTITDATWAGGIWAGAENVYVDVFQSNGTTLRTSMGKAAVTAVNSDTKVLTITGATANSVIAGDLLYFYGANVAGTFGEMAGLQAIIGNAGTLFNINAATYSLWKGTSITSFGQPSFLKIQDAVARAVNKGLMEKVSVLMSPKAWSVLNSDQASLRMFSVAGGRGENGFDALTFFGPNGEIELVSHPLVKDGDMFILPLETVARIGSTDVTFGVPGMSEEFFTLVSGKNAVELQCMTDQAIFLEKPAHAVYISGVTYAT